MSGQWSGGGRRNVVVIIVAAVVAVVVCCCGVGVAGLVASSEDDGDARSDPTATATVTETETTEASEGPAVDESEDPGQESDPEPRTYRVVHVTDGDTLDLGNGETVRLVGIDTPEQGECGYDEATAMLQRLVGGEDVTLGESDEDTDQYGRLLRYVDRGRVDAGLALIEAGLAIARYDSRDGYGRHPRERVYIAADRSSPEVQCAPPPRRFANTRPDRPDRPDQPDPGCASGYSPCIPAYPPDLDCGDVDGPITVTGGDPHGLDGEGDGIACE